MKQLTITCLAYLITILTIKAQVQIDNSGSTVFRNPTISDWTGTTKLTLAPSSLQNSGFLLSYKADSSPRIGRLTLNNN